METADLKMPSGEWLLFATVSDSDRNGINRCWPFCKEIFKVDPSYFTSILLITRPFFTKIGIRNMISPSPSEASLSLDKIPNTGLNLSSAYMCTAYKVLPERAPMQGTLRYYFGLRVVRN